MISLQRIIRYLRLLIVIMVLLGLFVVNLSGVAIAQDDTSDDEPTGDTSAYNGCGECHVDVVAAWDGGVHHMAYTDPVFQDGWEEQNNDPACLECHTTGYSPATQEYEEEGITCIACHGETPGEHPPAPVDLSQANEVCADCHTVTEAEFRASHHETAGMTCTSCHYAHNNGLRMGDELSQCLNCHGEGLDGFVAHARHIENGLTCRDCHGYVRPDHEIPVDGLASTGHDFQESIVACLDCHEDIRLEATSTTAEPIEETPDVSGEEAALRVQQLEAAVTTLILQNRNQSVMNLTAGSASGLVVGGLVAWVLARRRGQKEKRGGNKNGEK